MSCKLGETMRIADEYQMRSGGQFCSVPHHFDTTVFFTKHEECYRVYQFAWIHDPSSHPGRYEIRIYSPIQDGLKKGRLFELYDRTDMFWEQYETFVLDIVLKDISSVIIGEHDFQLAAWEMFLYVADSHLAEKSICRDLYSTVDLKLPIEVRFKNYVGLLAKLGHEDNSIYSVFNKQIIQPYVNRYSSWIETLVTNASKISSC